MSRKQWRIGQPGDQEYLDRPRAYLQASPEARRRGAERWRRDGDLLAARATEEGRVTDLLLLLMMREAGGRPMISRN